MRRAKGKSRRDEILTDVLVNNNDEADVESPVTSTLLYGYMLDRGNLRAAKLVKPEPPKNKRRRT